VRLVADIRQSTSTGSFGTNLKATFTAIASSVPCALTQVVILFALPGVPVGSGDEIAWSKLVCNQR
jgi:hypothetical protein